MGRWDALKPDENSGLPRKGNHSTSKWSHSQNKQDLCGAVDPDREPRPWTIDLEDQLKFHEKAIDQIKLASVLKRIREWNTTSDTETTRGSASLVHLVRLVEINDETILRTVLTLFCETISYPKLSLRGQELTECIAILSEKARSESDSSHLSLQCLIKLLSSHMKQLHAEDTVQQLVGPIFVPALQACHEIEATQISICSTIDRLLTLPRFACAMMAPLVHDVSSNGEEETMPNTVRRDLFRSLQNLLFEQAPSNALKSMACSTLAMMVETSQSTDEGRNAMITADLEQRKLDDFIVQNLDAGLPLHHSCLLLLKALLSIRVTATHYATLLVTSPSVQRQFHPSKAPKSRCRFCSLDNSCSNPFLGSLHKAISTKASGTALECTAKMVTALPWNLWFGQQPSGRGQQLQSGFHRQVVISIIQVFEVASCFVRQKREWHQSFDKLVTTLFDVVPWKDESLIEAGQELWSAVANAFVETGNATIASLMIVTLGGKITPQGNVAPMPLPMQPGIDV